MAKRKRLTPANPGHFPAEPEPARPGSRPLSRAPIADVASDASNQAALEEMAEALTRAREEGRMVLSLPIASIDQGYLVRDRVTAEDAEMAALKASLRDRGQQVPVEVVALEDGRYGLISGWRRCQALSALQAETGEAAFAEVLGLLRRPAEMSESYLAMVEENEIRANLSFFERARIAAKAVDQGVFETEKAALLALFRAASRAKRSKIRSFLPLVRELDSALRFPQAISERQGLALSKRLEREPGLAERLRRALERAAPVTVEAEQQLLNAALNGTLETKSATKPAARAPAWTEREIRPGLSLRRHPGNGRIELRGAGATEALFDKLAGWLAREG